MESGGHREALAAAVAGIGGTERPGQLAMADAVAASLETGRHLLVQAGTGTGKSLGYLTPVLLRLTQRRSERIVIATATLALQSQLANNDIPAALDAVEAVTGSRPDHAILKGRTNYACLLRVRDGAPPDQGTLISADGLATAMSPSAAADSSLGAEVLVLREWAEQQDTDRGLADRDDAPSHTDRAWQQVSIPVRECLGVHACPQGNSCFVERSREHARAADLVVTNHALLAINAMHGGTALPEHDAVIVDEAHELVSRVTGAASAELSPQLVERVGRRALTFLEDELALELLESADLLRSALDSSPLERIDSVDAPLVSACEAIRSVTRRAVSAMTGGEDSQDGAARQAAAAVKEVFDIAERMAALNASDVVWVSDSERFGREAHVAPLSVAGLMRSSVFGEHTTVLTSATLKIGGDFAGVAASVGLRAEERCDDMPKSTTRASGGLDDVAGDDSAGEAEPDQTPVDGEAVEKSSSVAVAGEGEPDSGGPGGRGSGSEGGGEGAVTWTGLDVGSPFDYRKQGILYVARSMPPPARDGLSEAAMAEIAELVWAAGGRTLGLFSSRRAAEAAAGYVRRQLPKMTILCQGDAQLSELTRRFVDEPSASLFGTLSLWQGVDVPGATCQLVIIDRIPFPRPDEPLTVARQRAVAEAGGNGFLTVAAAHAALLLAQGSGRLIRRVTDKGVVAVLDPRLATARYGSFLRASMPDMWPTTDRETAIEALRRLAASA